MSRSVTEKSDFYSEVSKGIYEGKSQEFYLPLDIEKVCVKYIANVTRVPNEFGGLTLHVGGGQE